MSQASHLNPQIPQNGNHVSADQEYMARELLNALATDDVERMITLLDNGANIQNSDWAPSNMSMMHCAAIAGSVKCIRQLALRSSDPVAEVNQITPHGTTPLHNAALSFNADAAITLIELGADVNAKHSHLKSNPLSFALGASHDEQSSAKRTHVCLALIAHGSENNLGMSPIEAAAKGGFTTKLGELLQDSDHDHAALIKLATEAGHLDAATLIRAKSAIDVSSSQASTLIGSNRPS